MGSMPQTMEPQTAVRRYSSNLSGPLSTARAVTVKVIRNAMQLHACMASSAIGLLSCGRPHAITRAQLSQRKLTVALLPDAQTPLSQNAHSHIQTSQITNPLPHRNIGCVSVYSVPLKQVCEYRTC